MSKEKLIPELRFPEFENKEWDDKPLKNVANITMGSSPKSASYNENKTGLPLLQGNADIKNRLSAPRIYTSEVTKECEIDDILLSVRAPVGTVAKSIHHACIGRGISAIKAKDENSQEFLYQWFFSFESEWKNISQGGTFDAVNSDDIKNLRVPIPQPQEQQKIASCLSSLDELIAAHNDKLDALKDHKKGLLQNLFPQEGETVPKVRFPEFEGDGEWVEKKLNTLSKRVIAKNRNGKFTAVFTNSATDGIVDQRDYFDKDIANKKNLENYFVVQNGDYVYNPRISEHAPVGPLFKNRLGKTGVMSPLYTVFRFNEKNNDFYEYYFQTSHWRNSIRAIANTGARFDRISITASLFMEIPVLYTGLMEQQKIASCLSAVDELITAQQEKIEQLQQHKKGLMQGLFPKIES